VGQISVDPVGGGAFGVAAEVVGYDAFIAAVDDRSTQHLGIRRDLLGENLEVPEGTAERLPTIPVQQCSFS
jgi:hypothetical protein